MHLASLLDHLLQYLTRFHQSKRRNKTVNQKASLSPPNSRQRKNWKGTRILQQGPWCPKQTQKKTMKQIKVPTVRRWQRRQEEKGPAPPLASAPLAPERDLALIPGTGNNLPLPVLSWLKEPKPCCFTESPENELQEASLPGFSTTQPHWQTRVRGGWQAPAMADYIANCTVKVDQLGSDDIHNALKQTPKVLVVQSFDMFKDKDLTGPMNENHGLNYTPALLKGGNLGIMSPLAKKAFVPGQRSQPLQQLPMAPHPLDQQEESDCQDDRCSSLSQAHHGQSTDHMQSTAIGDPARAELQASPQRRGRASVTFLSMTN